MSRKDFVAIAAKLAHVELYGVGASNETIAATETLHWRIVGDMADVLALTNPRFDRARFVKACKA